MIRALLNDFISENPTSNLATRLDLYVMLLGLSEDDLLLLLQGTKEKVS